MQVFLRGRLDDAYADGFSLLRRCPSTTVWRTLGYLESLSDAERHTVFDGCTAIAEDNVTVAMGLAATPVAPVAPVGAAADEAPRSVLFRAIFSASYWSAFPDRFMTQFGLDAEGLTQMVDASRIDVILASELPLVAKAGAIRKVLHAYLKTNYQADIQKRGAGEWACRGRFAGNLFGLWLDYGGRGSGFNYGFQFPPQTETNILAGGLTLEATYGFPTGIWDFPLVDELPQLCETIRQVIEELAILQSDAQNQ